MFHVLPHIGSATEETRAAMSLIAAKNMSPGLKGERLPFIVNPEIYNQRKCIRPFFSVVNVMSVINERKWKLRVEMIMS